MNINSLLDRRFPSAIEVCGRERKDAARFAADHAPDPAE